MSELNFIKELARYGLENDQEKLFAVMNELIEHSKKSKKINFALQLQSLLKEAIKQQQTSGLVKVGSPKHYLREDDKETNEFIIEKLTSDYSFNNLVCSETVKKQLHLFVEEHRGIDLLRKYNLPVSNKLIFHGPSGCGKTLAAYVLAGELKKMMVVVNLGAIVSSRLGETSKNLSKVFRKAALEDSIIFLDEFDSLGKVRDYNQDHGEMKRVVNTILQLFDFLPQESLVIAATNHIQMIDNALTRRFDFKVEFDLPDERHAKEIVSKTLANTSFSFDKPSKIGPIVKDALGLSYYSIQKTVINAIKKSLFSTSEPTIKPKINTEIWKSLVIEEKRQLVNH